MALQRFLPQRASAQALWYGSFAQSLQNLGSTLGLPPAEVADCVADALFLAYSLSAYRVAAKTFAASATVAIRTVRLGKGTAPQPMPEFTPPPLPGPVGNLPAVVPVPPGAQKRVLRFVQLIRARPSYRTELGTQLGIVGAAGAAPRMVPSFTLEVITGMKGQQVRVRFKKHGRKGVVIFSRRAGGDWESLGIDLASPFVDGRALLVPGQPETREYRLRFFEDDASTGDYTPVASVIVGG